MGTFTRIATVGGLLLGLCGVARAQSAAIHASATVLPAPGPVAGAPVVGEAALHPVGGGATLAMGVHVPGAREFQLSLRVERDAGVDSPPEVIGERRVAAPKGGRGTVEVPLPAAALTDLPEGRARARCTVYFGLDGSR